MSHTESSLVYRSPFWRGGALLRERGDGLILSQFPSLLAVSVMDAAETSLTLPKMVATHSRPHNS